MRAAAHRTSSVHHNIIFFSFPWLCGRRAARSDEGLPDVMITKKPGPLPAANIVTLLLGRGRVTAAKITIGNWDGVCQSLDKLSVPAGLQVLPCPPRYLQTATEEVK